MGVAIWAKGDAYEPYVGRWSRLVAREFLAWLDVPAGARWLDVGCGTGALGQVALAVASPSEVVGIDTSQGFIDYAAAHTDDPRARFTIGDARQLPFAPATFDAVVAGLVVNHVPEPDVAVTEMVRVARPGGVAAAYVWDYSEGMELMRRFWDAAVAIDPDAAHLDQGTRFGAICRPDALAGVWDRAGLRDVETRAIDVPTVFRDFDDYWTPFLGGQGPAPTYVATLPADRRDALRERLRASLPVTADGTISLTARAWAVRGRA